MSLVQRRRVPSPARASTQAARWPARPLVPADLPGPALLVLAAAVTGYGWTHPHLGIGLAPFFAFWHPRLTGWAAAGAVVLVAALAGPLLLRRGGPVAFCAGVTGLALVARLALNAIRYGPREWARPFTAREAAQEYIQTVHLVPHPLAFLERFAARVPHLPTHSAGHPPGPTLLAVGLDRAGLGGPWPLAGTVVLVGTLAAPLTYLVARQLLADERTARVAALAWVFIPASMIESVTSMDAVFATLSIAVVLAFVSARRWLAAAGVWLLSFTSYALGAVPVWAALVVWRRRSLAEAVRGIALAVIVTVGAYVLLRLAIGYSLLGALRATRLRYLHGPGSDAEHRPQRFWLAGDLAAFTLGLGIPTVLAIGRSLAARLPEAWALAAIAVAAAAGGYTKGEVERIWLFMVPLAAIAAAPALARWPMRMALMVLAAQALAVELLLATVW